MKLIKCPSCGKDISSEASKCPGCGYRVKPNYNDIGWRDLLSFFCGLVVSAVYDFGIFLTDGDIAQQVL